MNELNKKVARRGTGSAVRLGMLAFMLTFVLAALLSGSGCGGTADNGAAPDNGFSLEAGAEVSVAGAGAETSDAAAEAGADTLTAAELPIDPGRELEFSANTPGTTTPVEFDLEGPWKFVYGADQASLTVSMEPGASGYSADSFPDARVAARTSWSPSRDPIEYSFQSRDDNVWTAYGRSDEDGRVVIYNNPSRAIIFPMSVGDSWIDSYVELEDGRSTEVTAENSVMARNRLTVPAGSFDAFLLQTKVTAKPRGRQATVTWDYTWFVPGIGRAAEIISLPGERREVFGNASAFYRLKSYR